MTDRLKDFIDTNFDEFNELEPPKQSWDRISAQMGHRQSPKYRIAKYTGIASAAALLGFFLFLGPLNNKKNDSINLAEIPEIVETEAYYTLQVKQKREQVYQLAGAHPELKTEMDNDLAELDSLMLEIKNDLKDNVSNAEVVDAMIQNYRMKLMILEDIMSFLEQKNNNTEKTTSYEL